MSITEQWPNTHYTTCTAYDTTQTAGLPTTQANALGQSTTTSYDDTSGAIPSSVVDLNGQTTSSSSYSSGNETLSIKQPEESNSYTSRQMENIQCADWRTLTPPSGYTTNVL